MAELISYRHKLTWAAPTTPLPTPEGIERVFIPTSNGPLDLHFCLPSPPEYTTPRPPILFVHGGFGSALCYQNFLPVFAAEGYPAYTISLRGHGNSWNPGYWKMYWTPRSSFIQDIRHALQYVKQNHPGQNVILCAHSAGGGLVQDLAAQGVEDGIGGLIMLSPIPGYGSFRVNLNWSFLDPWMTLRMIFLHFFHPRSPLSSTLLVHAAFFSHSMPTSQIVQVEKQMAVYESMSWPMSMLRQFVDPIQLVKNLGWGASSDEDRQENGRTRVIKAPILVVGAEEDKLMTIKLMQRLVDWYKSAISSVTPPNAAMATTSTTGADPTEGRIALRVVKGAAHHMMLDVHWKDVSDTVIDWLKEQYKY